MMLEVIASWVNALMESDHNGSQRPLLSQRFNVQNIETAYRIQMEYSHRKLGQGSTIYGYKAALTAEAGQKLFGADGPSAGILFSEGKRVDGASLDLKRFHRPGLEVEIGYRLNSAVTEPVNRDTVMAYIGEILPMVEIVDLGYRDPKGQQTKTHAVDFIAGNCAASQYIVGKFEDFDGEINKLEVQLSRNDELLFTGLGSDALGNQLDSLVYLINQTLSQNHSLLPGHYLMTGSLGRLFFAQPGNYTASYGGFGDINFSCS